MSRYTASLDDLEWVRARYLEAKELINDIREAHAINRDVLDLDLFERVEDFHEATFLDTCTTLGPDCGCNGV